MEEDKIWNLMARKLSGEALPHELTALQELMDQQPELREVYAMMAEHWDAASEEESGKLDGKYLRLWQAISEKKENQRANKAHFNISRLNTAKWLTAAACIVLAVVFAIFFTNRNGDPAQLSEVSTRNGSRTKIILPDGSAVWLNAGSRLTYTAGDFTKEERAVHLTGEAFFDVEPMPDAPFIVHTQQAKVQVLGTSFDIKAYPEDGQFEAALITGAIVVIPKTGKEKTIQLKPGQRITLSENRPGKAASPAIHLDSIRMIPVNGGADSLLLETAWIENKLAFTSEPFYSLAAKIERWYNVKINFADTTVKNYRFTGVFEDETLEQALSALQFTGSFKYRIVKNEIFIEE
ncbi:FecR family protein [Chitinophaga barathri]|uniref:DUF4974 domain-containing protein n=1 Tax=Chitinophaga barathri TaxID=1647451 RepID=A0A3N4MGQ3_9BACT|nr:FecR domain-containing protein [Chitinophaga barathri]RPD43041.1 DUF4974 domain-containing protein [Chitinophaga barathri]